MRSLSEELREHHEEIVQRWLQRWSDSLHPRPELSEAALKDHLPAQLQLIGEQLHALATAEDPARMWKVTARLVPEQRVAQDVAIEEVVLEYGLVIDVVRDWIRECKIAVPFDEFSYFYQSIYELAAESVKRYASHQLELVRSARSHYLAALLHQMRTPMAVLSMQVELLERSREPIGEETVQRCRRSFDRIRSILHGVLRLERFAPDDVPLHPQRIHVAHLLSELAADVADEARRKGLRLELRADAALQVTLDLHVLVDALGNLLQNAVKYTHRGFVTVEAEAVDGEVLFRVRDSGAGISPEQQRTLFREEQRGGSEGMGIGLLIASHAAKAQGGTVAVESELGHGSLFSLRLPREVAARHTDAAAQR